MSAESGFTFESLRAGLRDPLSPSKIVDITLDDYDLVFETASRATFFLMQTVHSAMAASPPSHLNRTSAGYFADRKTPSIPVAAYRVFTTYVRGIA